MISLYGTGRARLQNLLKRKILKKTHMLFCVASHNYVRKAFCRVNRVEEVCILAGVIVHKVLCARVMVTWHLLRTHP